MFLLSNWARSTLQSRSYSIHNPTSNSSLEHFCTIKKSSLYYKEPLLTNWESLSANGTCQRSLSTAWQFCRSQNKWHATPTFPNPSCFVPSWSIKKQASARQHSMKPWCPQMVTSPALHRMAAVFDIQTPEPSSWNCRDTAALFSFRIAIEASEPKWKGAAHAASKQRVAWLN